MTITINNSTTEISAGDTLDKVLADMGMPAAGIAVAVDNKVVPKAQWPHTLLHEGARLTVIRAVCGG